METQKSREAEPSPQIIRASPDDVRDIQNVLYKSWLATYPNEEYGITVEDIEERYKNRFDEERLAKRRGQIERPSIGEMTLVAKIDNHVVGLCRVITTPEQNQLQALYVLPEFQGKGIGTALWEEGKKYLDPRRDIELWTAVYNQKAQAFYRSLGFVETGNTDLDPNFRMPVSGNTIPEIEMVRKTDE